MLPHDLAISAPLQAYNFYNNDNSNASTHLQPESSYADDTPAPTPVYSGKTGVELAQPPPAVAACDQFGFSATSAAIPTKGSPLTVPPQSIWRSTCNCPRHRKYTPRRPRHPCLPLYRFRTPFRCNGQTSPTRSMQKRAKSAFWTTCLHAHPSERSRLSWAPRVFVSLTKWRCGFFNAAASRHKEDRFFFCKTAPVAHREALCLSGRGQRELFREYLK